MARKFSRGSLVLMAITLLLSLGWLLLVVPFYHRVGLLPGQLDNVMRLAMGKPVINVLPHRGVYWLNEILAQGLNAHPLYTFYCISTAHFVAGFAAAVWMMHRLCQPLRPGLVLVAMGLAVFTMVGLQHGLDALGKQMVRTAFLPRNITHTAMLPYMFVAFGLLHSVLPHDVQPARTRESRLLLLFSLFLLIVTVCKPTFTLSAVPALATYLWLHKRLHSGRWLLVACLPSLAVVAWQGYVSMVESSIGPVMAVVVAPFKVWHNSTRSIPIDFIGSTALALTIAFCRHAQLQPSTRLAWLNLGIALIPYILLMETNAKGDRNFEWSYLNAKILLYACACAEWWRWLQALRAENRASPSAFPLGFMLSSAMLLIQGGKGIVHALTELLL